MMKYIVLLFLLVISSCSSIGTGSENKDDTIAPTLQIEHVNRGEGESFSSF